MIVFESVKGFLEIIIAPFQAIFGFFADLKGIITGIIVLSLGYFGWRAIK